jgi:hypothetical protein
VTRGERAAVRFVRDLIPNRALAVIGGPRHPEYERVLTACRRDLRLPQSGRSLATKRLIAAFPHESRHKLTQLLFAILDVEFDRRRVHERAAFRVGVVVGRSQRAACRRKARAR